MLCNAQLALIIT